MSSMDMDTEANLAAVALVRLAVEHRDHAGGSVMNAIHPYLMKYWSAAEHQREDGSVDIGPAITRLLAHLSQLAGASFEAYLTMKSGGVKPTKEQLFDRLGQYELGLLAEGVDEGGDGGGAEERG
jgi:hypothetical protein